MFRKPGFLSANGHIVYDGDESLLTPVVFFFNVLNGYICGVKFKGGFQDGVLVNFVFFRMSTFLTLGHLVAP